LSKAGNEEAETFAQQSLRLGELEFGPEHEVVSLFLDILAALYENQRRYADAEPLYERSLAIREKALGADHPDVAESFINLASFYDIQGRYTDAEPLYVRSLAIMEKAVGPDHPDVTQSLNNLANLYVSQGRYAKAEPLYGRSLAIREKTFGPHHPRVATGLNNLAALYEDQGRYSNAESLYKRSLAIREKVLGLDHPDVALSLNNLAWLYDAQGQINLALDYIRRSSAIHRGRAERAGGRSGATLSEQKTVRHVFASHIRYALAVADRKPSLAAALTFETFEVGQLAQATSVGAAVANMGARFGTDEDALARTVRKYQDAVERWQWLDKKFIDAVGRPSDKRNNVAEKTLRARLTDLDLELKGLDMKLVRDFPEYAELISPKPVLLEDASKLLSSDEALMTWLARNEETYLWVVRSDRAAMKRLDIGREALTDAVAELRGGLDPIGVMTLSDIPAFNTTTAFELYQKIFAAAEPLLDGVNHVFAVPDGALQSLPLGVLVTYKQVRWLARKYALTTLPTVSSLRALRRFAKATRANKPFFGFGDPLLEGHPGKSRSIQIASLFKARGIADVNAVRTQLAPLPETADELRSMATILGASDGTVLLREKATERNAKTQNLKDYRVLAFATHGLVSGDLKGLAEPALAFTPPEIGTIEADGLLTASEVTELKLNADLVILSACNTASADGTPGAEALSGLAKAFFYAGTRALLVSHWPVNSDASVQLTTMMLKEVANDNVGHAEALKRSMLSLMGDNEKPYYAHPTFWAPFVVVGEGGKFEVN
jgi:CHAT domain-containing protein